eukprot:3635205-Rhodomonas_salina.1
MSAVAVARPSTRRIHREPVRPVSFRIPRTRRSALALSAAPLRGCTPHGLHPPRLRFLAYPSRERESRATLLSITGRP